MPTAILDPNRNSGLPDWARSFFNDLSTNPVATSFGVSPRALKLVSEELVDTIPQKFTNSRVGKQIQDMASKFRSIGFAYPFETNTSLAGKGYNIPADTGGLYRDISSVLNKLEDTGRLSEQTEALLRSENPEELKKILSILRHGDVQKAIGRDTMTKDPVGMMVSDSRLGPSSFRHEMTHLGQDVAPRGLLRNVPPEVLQGVKYNAQPHEIMARLGESKRMSGAAQWLRRNYGGLQDQIKGQIGVDKMVFPSDEWDRSQNILDSFLRYGSHRGLGGLGGQ